jgi:flagellar hook-length control protein FliK
MGASALVNDGAASAGISGSAAGSGGSSGASSGTNSGAGGGKNGGTSGGAGQSATQGDGAGGRATGLGAALQRNSPTGPGEGATSTAAATLEDGRGKGTAFAEAFSVAQAGIGTSSSSNPAGIPAMANPGTPISAAPEPQAQATVSARPGSEAFGMQASQQITVFVRDGVHTARLNLNPAEMGPVTVQIQLEGLNAQVHLAAEQGLTRQALEQSMPMLASQLREAGLTLTGGGVFEQPRQTAQDGAQGQSGNNPRDSAQAGNARPSANLDEARPGTIATSGGPVQRTRGMVDLVA